MKRLTNNFTIKTQELSEIPSEPIEDPLQSTEKDQNLKFEPLATPTIMSKTNQPLDAIENILYGITSGKVPKKEAKERPM